MNPGRLTTFIEAYAAGLVQAITAHKHRYSLKADDTPETFALRGALKVHELIERDGLGAVHTDADGFRNACRSLAIDHSERSINKYLEVPV